jgi:glycosyltransferase involved in cell wall biosynthesis
MSATSAAAAEDVCFQPGVPETSDLVRPRVLFISPVSDMKGGAERVLLELLANPWLQPVLAVPEPGELSDAAERAGVRWACYHPTALSGVHRPPKLSQILAAIIDTFRCASRLRRIAREQRCDLIHTNGLKADALGMILRGLFGCRVLVHLHDIPYTRVERLIWRGIGLFATRVIVVSQPCWPGRPTGRVVVLRNAVKVVRPPATTSPRLDKMRLGFVGRYHPNKGLDVLLDWVKGARDAGIAISLVMRGRPDPDHPDYWARIRGRIKNEKLEAFVTDQGWRPNGNVYEDIDVLLVPSERPDPAPLVIPEAMAAGLVVIGFPSGGIPDLIPPGTGSLASTTDAFVDALRAYRDTPGFYEQVRAAGYRHVQTAHDPKSLANRFAAICRDASAMPAAHGVKRAKV